MECHTMVDHEVNIKDPIENTMKVPPLMNHGVAPWMNHEVTMEQIMELTMKWLIGWTIE